MKLRYKKEKLENYETNKQGCEFENFPAENLFESFQKFVNYLCQSAVSKSSVAK